MNSPKLFGASIGEARFKSVPEDFQVEEILGFVPSGEGEHCFLWIEKRDRNSNDVATQLARQLGIRRRLVSHCGLKDKNAVTRQWFSLHLPGQASPAAADLESEGIKVLKITRNFRKLHRGAHDGNRFTIRLRECTFSKEAAELRWQRILDRGVPNYFGSQRFGRNDDNLEQARRLFQGNISVKDREVRGILISAARSYLFNACVAARVEQGNWDRPLEGEVFGFASNKSLILPKNLRGDESDRFEKGMLELTAPLWGKGNLGSRRAVQVLEQEVAQRHPELSGGLARIGLKQQRRVIRLHPVSPDFQWEADNRLALRFGLPKGTYATTLIRELADCNEWH